MKKDYQCLAPHCPGGCAVATSYTGGLSSYTGSAGGRGPFGVATACGSGGGLTAVCFGIGVGGAGEGDEVVVVA